MLYTAQPFAAKLELPEKLTAGEAVWLRPRTQIGAPSVWIAAVDRPLTGISSKPRMFTTWVLNCLVALTVTAPLLTVAVILVNPSASAARKTRARARTH